LDRYKTTCIRGDICSKKLIVPRLGTPPAAMWLQYFDLAVFLPRDIEFCRHERGVESRTRGVCCAVGIHVCVGSIDVTVGLDNLVKE
jgi:hypothetical protein